MAISLENERVAEDGFQNFASAGKPQLLVEFSGVVEAEHLLRLFGKVLFGFGEKSEMGISEEDAFEVRNEIGLSLNQFGSWAFFFLAFLLEFLGGFGDEEGGGEVGGGGENVMEFRGD